MVDIFEYVIVIHKASIVKYGSVGVIGTLKNCIIKTEWLTSSFEYNISQIKTPQIKNAFLTNVNCELLRRKIGERE